MKQAAKNLILIFFTICFLFLAGELAIRLLSGKTERSELTGAVSANGSRADNMLNHAHVPGLEFVHTAKDGKEFRNPVKYNSRGLHDHEYTYEKGPGTTRILVLGDSFVEALQVPMEKNFCEITEQELNSALQPARYEVINMGVSGYSPILEYLYLKKEGLKYGPDIVILFFFMNDVYDDFAYKSMARFGPGGLPLRVGTGREDKTKKLKGCKRFRRRLCNSIKGLINKSKFYVFLKERTYRLQEKAGKRKKEPEENRFLILTEYPESSEHLLWPDTLGYISAARNLAERQGAKFLFVTIPVEGQLFGGRQDAVTRFYLKGKPFSERSEKKIAEFCGHNHIKYISLRKEFDRLGAEGLYFKYDGHFTEKAHREVSGIILEKLKHLGWVPDAETGKREI